MKIDFFRKKTHKAIMRMAWPSITEQTLVMMVGMVSTIFVGRIGKEAMAAVGMINTLLFFFQTIFFGLSTGTTVVIARLIGEGKKSDAKVALIQSFFMCILSGLIITVFGYIFAVPVLKVLLGSAEQEVFEIALKYYRIVLISLSFMVFDIVIAGAVRGAGDTKTPMYITTIVNIINVVLCSFIIFGVNINGVQYVPALGVTGTAIAVTVSRICGALMRLAVLYWKNAKIRLTLKDRFILNKAMMARIIKVGIPAFLEQLVMQGGFLVMQTIVITMGTVPTAAYQVGGNINSLAFMPIFGFAITATTLVGQSLGSKDYVRAEEYSNEIRKISMVIITCIGILMFVFARPLAMLYSSDTEVVNLSVYLIRIFAILEPFLAIMNIASSVLRAAGDIMYVTITAVIGLWMFRVLTSIVLHKMFGLGIYGIMIGISLDFITRAMMYLVRERRGQWKYLSV